MNRIGWFLSFWCHFVQHNTLWHDPSCSELQNFYFLLLADLQYSYILIPLKNLQTKIPDNNNQLNNTIKS